MDLWSHFTEATPWFIQPGQKVVPASSRPPGSWKAADPAVPRTFPKLCELLAGAHTTEVLVSGKLFILFSWPVLDVIPAWLCPAVPDSPSAGPCAAHRTLLSSFGGIVERADEPDSWLLNHDEVLTVDEAAHDAAFLRDHAWAFPAERIPLETGDYYCIAREANGNTTLCHRRTAEVILFAPDHSFEHVRPWRGLPDYTLYELNGAPDFVSFVEHIAAQWLESLGQSAD